MNERSYVWGIWSSNNDGVMEGTGCGHSHGSPGDAGKCLAEATARMVGKDREIINSGVSRADGERLNPEEADDLMLGEFWPPGAKNSKNPLYTRGPEIYKKFLLKKVIIRYSAIQKGNVLFIHT